MQRHILSFSLVLSVLTFVSGLPATAATSDEPTLNAQAKEMDALAAKQGGGNVTSKMSAQYSTFAGSQANADSLVNGLRNGRQVTLTSTDAKGATTSTSFTPPTGKMGYGNVSISLAMAKQDLANAGITQPTPQQLQTALMGGTITTQSPGGTTSTTFRGVLQMRSDGMGWGQIAQASGYKLGPVISSVKASNRYVANPSPTPSTRTVTTVSASGATGAAKSHSSGVVTGAGTSQSTGTGATGAGNRAGQGIVTGSGAPAAGSHGASHGQGVVNASGAPSTGAASANAAARGQGIVTGSGSAGGGTGNAYGHGRP
jgi:hypothetical protein